MPLMTDYMRRCTAAMPVTELGLLTSLLTYVCDHQCLLPLDRTACNRIAHAHTRDEQRALDRVLAQHFDITDHGRAPRHGVLDLRCQPRIQPADDAPARDGAVTLASTSRHAEPSRQDGQRSVTPKERQKRYRESLEPLRRELITKGVFPRRNAGRRELEELLRVTPPRDASVTGPSLSRPLRAPTPGIPIDTNTEEDKGDDARASDGNVTQLQLVSSPTPTGRAAMAMKQAGLPGINPSHPRFLALLKAGVPPEEFADVAHECVVKGKGFAYVLAVVENRRREVASMAALPAKVDVMEQLCGPRVAAALRGETPR